MINHITLKVSDLDAAKTFYEKALAPLGYRVVGDNDSDNSIGFGVVDHLGKRDFWIIEAKETLGTPSFTCLAFKAGSKDEVEAFYGAAIGAGGKDNGAPGYRPRYHAGYYAAFVLDLDGRNIEAVFDDFDRLNAQDAGENET